MENKNDKLLGKKSIKKTKAPSSSFLFQTQPKEKDTESSYLIIIYQNNTHIDRYKLYNNI